MKKQHRGDGSKRDASELNRRDPESPARLLAAASKAAKPRSGEADGSTAVVERYGEALRRVGAIPVPLTLDDACRLVGQGVEAQRFAFTALDTLAEEIEAVADGASSDTARLLSGIAERARFASRVERMLSEQTS